MTDYSRVIRAQRAEKKRKQLFFGIVAGITIAYVWVTWWNANKVPGFELANFFAADPNVEVVSTSSGLKYQDLVVGDDEVATDGNQVVVHYTGWLTDETKFDSSVDRNSPFEFVLGAGRVIQGWDEGVAGMRVGGTRLLMIPAALGYGDRGSGSLIPGGATLIFQVELLEIISE